PLPFPLRQFNHFAQFFRCDEASPLPGLNPHKLITRATPFHILLKLLLPECEMVQGIAVEIMADQRTQYEWRNLSIEHRTQPLPETEIPDSQLFPYFLIRIFVCLYEIDGLSAHSDNVFLPKTEFYFAFCVFCEIETKDFIASGTRLAPDAAKCSHFREAILPLVS